MPASAYGLISVFAAVSVTAGVVSARLVGPWRWWTALLPAAGAFGILYLVGHRWALSIGPDVELFGWDVALPFDIAAAMSAAGVVALVQRGALELLQAQQRRPGGDGLA